MISGIGIARKSYNRDRIYLVNHIINNFGSLIFGYINVSIWLSVLGRTSEGYEMVTYLMVNQASLWVVMFLDYGCYIPDKVYNGRIAYEFLRPYGLLYGSFFEVLGHLFYNFLFRSIPIFVFGVVFMGVKTPELSQILPYAISLICGMVIAFFINYFIGLWSIKFISINGIQMLYYFASGLFSGSFIHFKYSPEILQKVMMKLPFAYAVYVPTAVYQGEMTLIHALSSQLIWIAILFIAAVVLTKVVTKGMTIQGG